MNEKLLAQLFAALVIFAVGTPSAMAQDPSNQNDAEITEEEVEEDEEKDEESKNWSVGGSVGTRVGQGTFVTPAGDSELGEVGDPSTAFDRVLMVYSLFPSYSFDPIASSKLDDFSVSLSFAFTQWLTQGGGANGPREARFQDIGLSLGWGGHSFEKTGIRLGGGLDFSFPTSVYSQTASTIVATGASLSLSKTFFERLSLSTYVAGGKTFHRFTSPVADISKIGEDNVLFRAGGNEDLGSNLVAIGGLNTEYSLSTGISARVKIVEKLSFSTSYGLGNYWTYKADNDDEFRNQNADSGRGFGQSISTRAALSYGFLDYFSLSGGISSAMAPKTSDNRSFRFPFWNTEGAASNQSSLYLTLSASY